MDINQIKELLIEFLDSNILVYCMYIYLLGLLTYIVYSILNYFKYNSRMKKTIMSLYTQMSEKEKDRAQEERNQRAIHGAGSKKDFLASLDEELAYSGIKDKCHWMTTELFLLLSVIVTAVASTVALITQGVLVGIVTLLGIVIAIKLIISLMANARDKKTESIMLQFMNIVDNFSKTSDDLISIFEKSARYIEEPLRTQISDAVIAARNSGDSIVALQELQERVRNKHFKVLVRNLEISSRYETNYSDIIEDCREIFHEYLKSEKEKRNIRMNGILEIITMLITGAFSVYMVGDVSDTGNIITALLEGGTLGMFVLVFLIFAVTASIYIAVFQVLRVKN